MAGPDIPSPLRISKIAGRYLIFDAQAVASLRRQENLSGTLVGTAPQQPTQNIFLGLPIELRPEEAEALVRNKAAYVVDDVAAHQAVLRSTNPDTRRAYIEALQRQKQAAQKAFTEKSAKKAAEVAERIPHANIPPAAKARSSDAGRDDSLSQAPAAAATPARHQPDALVSHLAVTPTSSNNFLAPDAESVFNVGETPEGPLCRHLQGAGYYMTPGLRFGSQYSVYPGDPLRFHAHFMANQYDWHQEIPILDIVGGGRLATAVKKAFLVGGAQPAIEALQDATVRTFSIEWAGM